MNISSITSDLLEFSKVIYHTNVDLSFASLDKIITITFVFRLFFYSLCYNPKTGFFIAIISVISAWFWLEHIGYVHKIYHPIIKSGATFRQFFLFIHLKYKLTKRIPGNINVKGSLRQFRAGISGANLTQGCKFRADPIALILSSLPDFIRRYTDKIYYEFYEDIIPDIFKIFKGLVNMSLFVIVYNICARIGKRYLPYHVRWHWTYICLILPIEQVYTFFVIRLHVFSINTSLLNQDYTGFFILQTIVSVLIIAHYMFLIFALLHAALGQYFFIPWLTYQVDVFVGRRPNNSLYSGGYTTWQKCNPWLDKDKEKGLLALKNKEKNWWGWFGRNDETEIELIRLASKNKFIKAIQNFFRNLSKK